MTKDILDWLQRWYHDHCDEKREHNYKIEIGTLDNPGWELFVDLIDKEMVEHSFTPIKIEREEHDWIICRIQERRFEGFGGPFNLVEVLNIFRSWAVTAGGEDSLSPSSVNAYMKSEVLNWLQRWYHSNCDEHWEHEYGVAIDTPSNPDWRVVIDLADTRMSEVDFAPLTMKRDDSDWFDCQVEEEKFTGTCGTYNLGELLEIFRTWAISSEGKDAASLKAE